MFCRQCGSQLPDGSAFCNKCGTKIVYLEEAPQPQQPVYAQPQLPPEPTVNRSNEQAAAALKKPASKKWLIVLIVILVLAVIGAGIYFLFFKQTYKLDYGTLDKDGTLTYFMAVDNMLIGKDENGGFTKLLGALRTVTSVTIPETVEIIETSAFYQCEKLTTVNGGTGLKYIGDTAFWLCRSLEHIELPDSVDHIGIQAFFACSSLKEFRVPKQLAELGSVVFEAGDYKDGLTLIVTSTETTIDDSNFSTDDNVTIRCYAGSAAESFAKEHDFKNEYLS